MAQVKTAAEHINALMEIHPKGFDLSLDRIKALLQRLGNPQDKLPPVIHVAGTNGKGSTIAFMGAMLEAAGLSVHVHTSPHLVNWSERYRLGAPNNTIGQAGARGQLVADSVLAEAIERVAKANDGQAITVFEVLTAVTFVLFSEHPADVCLIEVGLGGRFDATNVMKQVALSVITPVSIDHEAYLGDTLAKIAFEKAGIIRRNTPLVVGPQEDEAKDAIVRQAARHGARTLIAGEDFSAQEENGRLIYQDENALLDLALPRLQGRHQVSNSATALAAVRRFMAMAFPNFANDALEHALDQGVQNAVWAGRMQHLTKGKLVDEAPKDSDIWLDGGHNPGAAVMVADYMQELNRRDPRPLVMVCGMLNTKDPSGYFAPFAALVQQLICVPILSSDAGIAAEELAMIAQKNGIEAKASASIEAAITQFKSEQPLRILIAGSLYLAGDALEKNETVPQ